MALPNRVQGRVFGPDELAEIRALLHTHPDWSRCHLSRQLARQWNWHSSSGQLKDMAARTLLGKLSGRGWIDLPALRRASPTRSGRRSPPNPNALKLDASPWTGQLGDLRPLQIAEISQSKARADCFPPPLKMSTSMPSIPAHRNVSAPQPNLQERLADLGLGEAVLDPWLEELKKCLEKIRETPGQGAGFIEETVRQHCLEIQRLILQAAMQKQAASVAAKCPTCVDIGRQ